MEIEINIDAEKINQYVAEAIIESAIGIELKRIINDEVSRFSRSYDNPITAVIRKVVADEIKTVIHEQFSDLIREKVVTALTEEKLAKIIDKAWTRLE